MAKNLVIVESPAKAKTINKILGKDYVVKASMGHVRDLPERKLGIDIDNGFEPQYVTLKSRGKILKELETEAKKAESIFLAPDPDREGEAIAWHLCQYLASKKVPNDRFKRVTYNEITAPAIRRAFESPSLIDQKRVDSQQARRVLDRIVGYKVSPLLWKRIKGASSAGRVQSVALRLVCERENEIRNFNPEEYWLLGAKVQKQEEPKTPFEIKLARIDDKKAEIKNSEQAESIKNDLSERTLKVLQIITRTINKKALPPYITSTLQQAASSAFGMAPANTMRIAQKLYEGIDFGEGPVGLITYMRTDSVAISKEAQGQCRDYVEKTYGSEYIPEKPNFFKSKSSAQEAHEAIRPTEVTRTPEEMKRFLDSSELKLYRLIWQRFVASQMSPAKIAQRTAEVEAVPVEDGKASYLFRATASEVVFPGYMKVTGIDKKTGKNGDDDEDATLPELKEGEPLDCLEWLSEQKFTTPPARFTEASLVRAMEENGVGRPSTYAQILSTLNHRKYVAKEKRSLKPTELGEKVFVFLIEHLNQLFDVTFTAEMEESLDQIEKGSVEWTKMLETFYGRFAEWVKEAKGPSADPAFVEKLLSLTATITEWEPEQKRGKRTYSDNKFVDSLKKQLTEKKREISERQVDALKLIICRYRAQIPEFEAQVEPCGLKDALEIALKPKEPPREESVKKLELLEKVNYDEPRKVGKRVYDDKAFCDSLRKQVESGKRLSTNQVKYLDRLFMKYAEQIEGYEALAEKLCVNGEEEGVEDTVSGPLIAALEQVAEWKPPVMRGKREWDDKKFYDSLKKQFGTKKSLSEKQQQSLKKMAARYSEQIKDYASLAEQFGLKQK